MTTVRPLELSDVEHVVTRVGDRLARDAEIQPLVNPALSTQLLADSLRVATDQTWVADHDGVIVGHLYGAKTTPHMFVISPDGKLIYQGGIDNKPTPDPADIPGATNYVRAALDESMAGKAVTVATSRPYGCSVKY